MAMAMAMTVAVPMSMAVPVVVDGPLAAAGRVAADDAGRDQRQHEERKRDDRPDDRDAHARAILPRSEALREEGKPEGRRHEVESTARAEEEAPGERIAHHEAVVLPEEQPAR